MYLKKLKKHKSPRQIRWIKRFVRVQKKTIHRYTYSSMPKGQIKMKPEDADMEKVMNEFLEAWNRIGGNELIRFGHVEINVHP